MDTPEAFDAEDVGVRGEFGELPERHRTDGTAADDDVVVCHAPMKHSPCFSAVAAQYRLRPLGEDARRACFRLQTSGSQGNDVAAHLSERIQTVGRLPFRTEEPTRDKMITSLRHDETIDSYLP